MRNVYPKGVANPRSEGIGYILYGALYRALLDCLISALPLASCFLVLFDTLWFDRVPLHSRYLAAQFCIVGCPILPAAASRTLNVKAAEFLPGSAPAVAKGSHHRAVLAARLTTSPIRAACIPQHIRK